MPLSSKAKAEIDRFLSRFKGGDELRQMLQAALADRALLKESKPRLTRILDDLDRFLSNHDGTYKEDARALWHIIGGATRGPDDEDSAAKACTINLRGIAFPRTARLGTGTGAAFTQTPSMPKVVGELIHFRQHASKAIEGLRRAGRIEGEKVVASKNGGKE